MAPTDKHDVEHTEGLEDREIRWPLGWLELRILRALWTRGGATVRDIVADIGPSHPVAYTTVMTVMSRLADKGLLRRDLRGKTYHYTPALTSSELGTIVSRHLFESLVAEFGDAAIAQFAAELDRIDPDRLNRLKQAAERREPK